ncbi:STAS domain-containing protein [Nonomuraea turkmeniaca]|uniref:Anti-sigma factor antagonist n=1 Tax=Nonomuraea turkmeniaca TaxID=103838 RepID=A0A5S4EZX4_9ACTN|nr:STAS domain-containing protein [Nonomuraea turkmeniaca]TMR09223.1 STAS domain-containing protein [Nonomuraea turkmeniaca]
MTYLSMTVGHCGDYSVVSLEGELDLASRQQFCQALDHMLTRPSPKIILDAAELRFCDSHGLWALITRQRDAEARGGCLRLIGVHGPLARLLTVTQLVDLFPPYADLDHAAT